MFGRVIPRVLFIAFVVVFAVYMYRVFSDDNVPIGRIVAVIATSLIVSVGLVIWEWFFQRNLARELVAILFGLTAGLFGVILISAISMLTLMPYNILHTESVETLDVAFFTSLWQLQYWLPMILSACLYIGVTVVLQTRDNFRFLIPYLDLSLHSARPGGILLDTSALIDGRVSGLVDANVFINTLLIPDYVLRELHSLADSADAGKRARGRRGLEIAKNLTALPHVKLYSRRDPVPLHSPVDNLLIEDAKELSARILTTDFNLAKFGSAIRGVSIININEIARVTKLQYTNGDALEIFAQKKGQEPAQAVGYLDDGTMVVIENGISQIGNRVRVVVTGSIQTNAGRMLFTRIDGIL